jgi:hypothetical protein
VSGGGVWKVCGRRDVKVFCCNWVADFGVYSGWRMKLPFDSEMRFPLILH